MRPYTKKVKGSTEVTYENDHYDRTWETPQGKQGVYILAQGHTDSTSKGYLASNRAVNILGRSIEEKLEQDPAAPQEDVHTFMITQWKEIQPKLGVHKTTLECLVVRNGTAHCYLTGSSQLYAVSGGGLVEQLSPPPAAATASAEATSPAYTSKELDNVKFLFLATSSLCSRVTEEQIATLLRTAEGEEAPLLLEKFAQLIRQPREKLLGLSNEKLYSFLPGQTRVPPDKRKELVDLIFNLYGRDQGVTERVDKELRYDDVTMMLIDIEDKMGALLARDGLEIVDPEIDWAKVNQELDEFKAKYEEEKKKREEFGKLLLQRDETVRQWEKYNQDFRAEITIKKAQLEGQLKAKEGELGQLAERLDRKNREHDRDREGWNREKVELKEREQRMAVEREHWQRDFTDRYERAQRELARIVETLGISSTPAGINDEQRKALVASKEIIQKYKATTSGATSSPATTPEDPAKADGAPPDGSPPKRSQLKRWGLGVLFSAAIAVGGYSLWDYYVEKGRPKFTPVTIVDYVGTSAKDGPDSMPGRSAEEEGQKNPAASTAETLPPSLSSSSATEKALGRGKRPSDDKGLSIIIDDRKPSYAPGDMLFGSFSSNNKEIDYSNCKSVGSLPAMFKGNSFAVNIPDGWKKNDSEIAFECRKNDGTLYWGGINLSIQQNSPRMANVPVHESAWEESSSPVLKITEFSCQWREIGGREAICNAKLNEHNKRISCTWTNENFLTHRKPGVVNIAVGVSNELTPRELNKFIVSVNPGEKTQKIRLECKGDGYAPTRAVTSVTSVPFARPEPKQK